MSHKPFTISVNCLFHQAAEFIAKTAEVLSAPQIEEFYIRNSFHKENG
jgi:hypothetical protein